MKMRFRKILIAAVVLAAAWGMWLLGYHTRKNPDNIPSKEILLSYWAAQQEDYARNCIQHYSRDMLRMVWDEPDGHLFGFYGDIWTSDSGEIIVYYNQNSKVTDLRCRLKDGAPVVSQSTYNGIITNIMTESKNPNITDNVLEVKTNRGEILYFTLLEETKITGTPAVDREVSITCEEYSYAGFLPVIDITVP